VMLAMSRDTSLESSPKGEVKKKHNSNDCFFPFLRSPAV